MTPPSRRPPDFTPPIADPRAPEPYEARVRVLKPEPDGLGADAEAVELVLRR